MKLTFIGFSVIFFLSSAWAGTFVETFSDRDINEWQEIILFDFKVKPGSWQIIDRELHWINTDQLLNFLTIGDDRWADYVIEFDVKPLEKHGPGNIGIAARMQETIGLASIIADWAFPDPEQGLKAICFGGDFHGKKFEIFGSEPIDSLLELGVWATMKLQANKEDFTFWVNGKQVLEARDPAFQFSRGGVGLILTNYTARFDNIVITGKGVPNKGELPIEPQTKLATIWGSLKEF